MSAVVTDKAEIGYPYSEFEAWCRRLGKTPTSLGLAGVMTFRSQGVVPFESAQTWAALLSVEVEEVWPSAKAAKPAGSKEGPTAPALQDFTGHPWPPGNGDPGSGDPGSVLQPLPAENVFLRGDRTRQCRVALVSAFEAYTAERDQWEEIEHLNEHNGAGVTVSSELQSNYDGLRRELRRIEAWYGSRVYADALAAMVRGADRKGESP